MKRLELKKDLAYLKKIMPTKSSLPILDNILIHPDYIYGTDLETNVVLHKKTGVTVPMLVNFKDLTQIVNEFSNAVINFNKTDDDKVEIQCNGTTVTLESADPEDYPALPKDDNLTIADKLDMINMENIKKAKLFMGNDDLRPIMQNVFIDKENIVATNAAILFKANKVNSEPDPYYISKDVISLIEKFDNVNVFIGDKIMEFTYGYISIITKIPDGKFPQYKVILPKEGPLFSIQLPTDKLSEICKIMKSYSSTAKLFFSDSKVNIVNVDMDRNREISTKIPYAQKTDEAKDKAFGLSVESLTTCLKSINTKMITIDAYSNNKLTLNENILLMSSPINE